MAGFLGIDWGNLFGGGGNKDMGAYSGQPGTYNMLETMTPEQKTLMTNMGSYYNNAYANGGFPQYQGQYVSPMNSAETKAIANQGSLADWYANQRASFTPGQINPETDANELRKYTQQFYGNGTDPGAKALAEEQFAGTGGYWGDSRAKGVMNTYANTVTNPYQNWRSTALQNSYKNALDYSTTGSVVNQTNQQMQAVPRLIQDANLTAAYNEFVRTRPESAANAAGAVNFLNLKGFGYGYVPQNAQNSSVGGGFNIGSILKGIGSLFSGGSGGGTPNVSSTPTGGSYNYNTDYATNPYGTNYSQINAFGNGTDLTSANLSRGNIFNYNNYDTGNW